MNYQRILVPYDGSEHAKAAFGAARDLALSSDSTTVYVVNVVPMASASAFGSTDPVTGGPSPFVDQEGYAALFDNALSTIKKEVVSDVEGLLDGLSADRVVADAVAHPSAAHGIAEYASDHGCDLIVMGRRGLGAVRGMLGSVSYGVLRCVDIPVLTVK